MLRIACDIAARVSAAALLIALFVSPVYAHVPDGGYSLKAMLAGADLAFYGEITDIVYADPAGAKESASQPKAGRQWAPLLNGTPHTFVTYKVIEEIYGRTGQKSVTLRFYGGPDGRGAIYDASAAPVFITGERQVMVIQGNGRLRTPTVMGELGQFREFQGGVYSSAGVALTGFTQDGWIAFDGGMHPALAKRVFPSPSFDGLLTRSGATERIGRLKLSTDAARARYEKEAPPQIVMTLVQEPKTAPARPLPMQALIKQLQVVAKSLPPPKTTFVSQDPRRPFEFEEHEDVRAPETVQGGTPTYDPNRWSSGKGGGK